MENLIDIRCPIKKRGKHDNKIYICNRVCVRVIAGSAGEARCKACRMSFEFEVDSQAKNKIGVHTAVRAKSTA